jgi:hypothetical protein
MSQVSELEQAVDEFAAAMKARLRSKAKQGWRGWDHMGREDLGSRLLTNAASGAVKGDAKSLVDVANLAMMIHRSGPAIDGVKACDLCAKGFPVENGQHHGTQALGMIPATPCTAGVPVVSASIPKQPLMAWLRKVLENTANSREERDAAGVLLRGLNADGVDLPDGAQP